MSLLGLYPKVVAPKTISTTRLKIPTINQIDVLIDFPSSVLRCLLIACSTRYGFHPAVSSLSAM